MGRKRVAGSGTKFPLPAANTILIFVPKGGSLMNTFFNTSCFRTPITKVSAVFVSLVILSAPIIAVPGYASAEEMLQPDQTVETTAESVPLAPTGTDAPVDLAESQALDALAPSSSEPSNIANDPVSETEDPANPVLQATPTPTEGETLDSTTIVSAENNLASEAITGNATVVGTSSAGALATGDATASTTTVSIVQSSVGLSGGAQPIIFTLDVVGDTNGDILIDPTALESTPIGTVSSPPVVSNTTQANIVNSLSLTAISGDALVVDNKSVDSIQTGDASAVANVFNLLNSAISADQSFIGTINILGNLNGDILIPAEFIQDLLASGQAIPLQVDTAAVTNSSSSVSISNTISSTAISGGVIAEDNKLTGTISTGDSKTSVNIINLIGQQTITKNTLLIFVNVLGTWTGFLFNAPAGSTTAALTSGPALNNSEVLAMPQAINQTSVMTIVNDITLLARTGSATAIGNKQTGSISTGNATTGANILNIVNSSINLSEWFGILFINVFGVWNGSLAAAPEAQVEPSNSGSLAETPQTGPPQVLAFMPTGSTRPQRIIRQPFVPFAFTTTSAQQSVAGDSTTDTPKDIAVVAQAGVPPTRFEQTPWIVLGGLILLAAGAIGARYYTGLKATH